MYALTGKEKLLAVNMYPFGCRRLCKNLFSLLYSLYYVPLYCLLNNFIMTQLILKTELDSNKLDTLLRFLDALDVDTEVEFDNATVSKSKSKSNYELFSKTKGMWKDRDIDARKLRREAWDGNKSL
jgi:hypothetical protein